MTRRYIVEYLPATAVARIAKRHAKHIAAGASVWDFTSPEYLTKEIETPREDAALAAARRVVGLDEYGEVHVYQQEERVESDGAGRWSEWETTHHASYARATKPSTGTATNRLQS